MNTTPSNPIIVPGPFQPDDTLESGRGQLDGYLGDGDDPEAQTVRVTWAGGDAPQVDTFTYTDGVTVSEGVVHFLDGVECRVEVVP